MTHMWPWWQRGRCFPSVFKSNMKFPLTRKSLSIWRQKALSWMRSKLHCLHSNQLSCLVSARTETIWEAIKDFKLRPARIKCFHSVSTALNRVTKSKLIQWVIYTMKIMSIIYLLLFKQYPCITLLKVREIVTETQRGEVLGHVASLTASNTSFFFKKR